jgi:hypothetical protein
MNTQPQGEIYPQRHSLRLRSYNYTWQGAYFVTICTQNRLSLFGQITDSSMQLNPLGEIVKSSWEDIPQHYPQVNNEVFIVMPNHIHGIVMIHEVTGRAGCENPPLPHGLSSLIWDTKCPKSGFQCCMIAI